MRDTASAAELPALALAAAASIAMTTAVDLALVRVLGGPAAMGKSRSALVGAGKGLLLFATLLLLARALLCSLGVHVAQVVEAHHDLLGRGLLLDELAWLQLGEELLVVLLGRRLD